MRSKFKCVDNMDQMLALDISSLPERLEPNAILMCDPGYFEVKDVKNLFMEGNVNKTSRTLAMKQWQDLKQCFEKLGYPIYVVPSVKDREDMVFTANQVLLGVDNLGPYVVLSRMVHDSRRKEVPYFSSWFAGRGYRILELQRNNDKDLFFEGQGDALWHPGKQLLYGGYGHRTSYEVYPRLSELLQVPIVSLQLTHPRFYHLDTAFCPLNQNTAMVFPPAFREDSLNLIKRCFDKVIPVGEHEAENFALNALALGNNVIIQKGSVETLRKLQELSFNPIEVDTSEFMKSGGSVSCLKMLIYS